MLKISVSAIHSGKVPEKRTKEQSEQNLWNDFRQGSESAYALIYQQYFFLLYGYGLKICSDKEVVKDCIQDLFVYIWKNKERLKETNSIKYYLFTSLKRRLIDNFSAQSRFDQIEDLNEVKSLGSTSSEESQIIAAQGSEEQKQRVLKALDKLTGRQKEAVVLKFYDNLPNDDIAAKMNISVEGVYNLVSKALNRCRKDISKAYFFFLSIAIWLNP